MRFLRHIFLTFWQQLPLLCMLIVFSTFPACFGVNDFIKTFSSSIILQVILPVLFISWIASLKRWIWLVVFIFANLFFFVELSCYFLQHTRFNSVISILIMQSNPSEASEFLSVNINRLFRALVVEVGVVVFFYLFNYYWRKKWGNFLFNKLKINNNFIVGIFGFLLTILAIVSPYFLYNNFKVHLQNSRYERIMPDASCFVVYPLNFLNTFFNRHVSEAIVATIESAEINTTNKKDDLTIVYVIGESFSRGHSSLFGYFLNTNPKLLSELETGSLFLFDNVISHSSQTIDVYPNLLSTCNVMGDQSYSSYPLLPVLMKRSNYYVSYFDNQSVVTKDWIGYKCTYFLSDPQIRDNYIDCLNNETYDYDGDFVAHFSNFKNYANNFTIYHLMGQHSKYKSRYPASFNKYKKEDYNLKKYSIEQAQIVSEYDNATLYTDSVIFEIINKIRDKNAVLIFVSDHGEEVYDYRDVMGRYIDVPINSIRPLFEVPAMIWVSDKYKEKYAEEIEMLRKNKHKSIYNSDLPHTILDLAGIGTDSFNPEVSLIREGKGRENRRILQIDYDYDKNRDRINSVKMRYE